jgi:hypothetical protein
MPDAVLAAIIAATATLSASFLQLRMALARDADARSRGQPISRRRGRLPMILIGIMLLASAVGGFALSQWLGDSQRSAQADLQRDLRERMAELATVVATLERLNAAAAPDSAVAANSPQPVLPATVADAPSPAAAVLPVATAATATGADPVLVAVPLGDARPMLAQSAVAAHTP